MFTRAPFFRRVRLTGTALVVLAAALLAATPAAAQTAQSRYEQALAREEAARAADRPNVATLRAIAVAYENIPRRYPRSGYSDNALWQGAGVLQLAWEVGGTARDRAQAIKLLEWLRKEYPSSTLAAQVRGRVAALNRPRPTVARTTTPPRSTPPAPPAERPAPTAERPAVRAEVAAAAPPTPAAPPPSTAATAPANAVVVQDVRHTSLPRGDRLTLELSREGRYTTERLDAPDELTLTLTDAHAAAAIVDAASRIRGRQIRSMRVQQDDARVQLVVRLDGRPRVSDFPLYGPYRLVLDFETEPEVPVSTTAPSTVARASVNGDTPESSNRPTPQPMPVASKPAVTEPPVVRESSAPVPAAPAATTTVASLATTPTVETPAAGAPVEPDDADDDAPAEDAAVPPAPPSSTSSGGYSLARQLGLGVSRIVIDPGHGGSDPGASDHGVTEAALVLDIALRLEKLLLAQPGFEVVLTRRTNTAVPLARRTAIANAEAADLFLSIHANSSPRTQTAGVETYYLNFASNPQAEAVAARENASSPQAMHSLPELVRAITMNNKIAESRELAGAVQSSLVRRLQPRNKSFQDLGVKQAPFVVLIGAQMPSVLAEVGFLTNRAEASLVKQGAYKQQIAQALCDAILRYQASLKKVATVTASAEGR